MSSRTSCSNSELYDSQSYVERTSVKRKQNKELFFRVVFIGDQLSIYISENVYFALNSKVCSVLY